MAKRGTHPTGGRTDLARKHARHAEKNAKKPAKAAPAGGKDEAKEAAIRGEKGGTER